METCNRGREEELLSIYVSSAYYCCLSHDTDFTGSLYSGVALPLWGFYSIASGISCKTSSPKRFFILPCEWVGKKEACPLTIQNLKKKKIVPEL